MVLCIHNSDILTRFNSLYGSQTSPVVLCMQNRVISTRIISLHESQPSFVVFPCKTATIGPELQVPMGPRPHLWFFTFKTEPLEQELQVSMGPSPHLWFCDIMTRFNSVYGSQTSPVVLCMQNNAIRIRNTSLYGSQSPCEIFACTTASFGSELQVSMSPRPYLSFCA